MSGIVNVPPDKRQNMQTLNLTELADFIGVSVRTLENMIKDGRFPVKPIKGLKPRRWYILHVKEWMHVNA